MQLYLEWTKRHDRREGEEDPIGLILCGSRGKQVVELLLSSQTNRMRVAQYLLPEDAAALKARLAQITAARSKHVAISPASFQVAFAQQCRHNCSQEHAELLGTCLDAPGPGQLRA